MVSDTENTFVRAAHPDKIIEGDKKCGYNVSLSIHRWDMSKD